MSGRNNGNMFRNWDTGALDKQYLRVCSVYKFLKRGRIDKEKAIKLLEERNVRNARGTVEIWIRNSELKNLNL